MSPRNQQKARALDLASATGLVIGSIIGTGVFAMPAVLGDRLAAVATVVRRLLDRLAALVP